MYLIIVDEANTRGSGDPIEIGETNTLDKALVIVNTFAKQYLSDPHNQYVIKLIPTSIY